MKNRALVNMAARSAWLWRNRCAFGEDATGDRPRLLVDVSAIVRHDAQTGIQRVVRAVWSELVRRKGDNFALVPVYATESAGYCYAPRDFLGSPCAAFGVEPARIRPGDKFFALDLTSHLLPKYRRQLRAWKANGATVHLLVYDLLPLLRPDWFNSRTVRHFRRWYSVLVNDADQAICISDHVAGQLRARLRQSGSRGPNIARIRLGGDIAASRPSTGLCGQVSQLLERMRFRAAVVMVGTIEPRKGYDVALPAFEQLWRTRSDAPDLVIIGKAGWKTEALQRRLRSHPEHGRRLHWLAQVSDEGLCRIYESARGVLVASRAEGLGLPLVEAAMNRRYVLARDLAVFREQQLSNVIYFQDDDAEALGARLMDLVELAQSGAPPAVTAPTWNQCIDGLLLALGFDSGENALPHWPAPETKVPLQAQS